MIKNRVFVLGDSRTGTSTLGAFLKALGYNSIHYFVKEANQISPDHLNHEKNWENLKFFIDNAPYEAFSDYPTRLFYEELDSNYPDAKFILTTRKDVKSWKNSMDKYFSKFNMNLNLDLLEKAYLGINDKIRAHFQKREDKLLEICIDDDSTLNSDKIKIFLSIQSMVEMGWENKSADVDIEKPSSRKLLYTLSKGDPISYLQSLHGDNDKGMLSEYGWIYLINDTNHFIDYYYGHKTWSKEDILVTKSKFEERKLFLDSKNSKYVKFIVPEKLSVYPEYLPKILADMQSADTRPATLIAQEFDYVHYLGDYLKDLKSYGSLYFRGDSHTNWLGAYYVYLYMVEKLNFMHIKTCKVIQLDELVARIAKYRGDLYTQIDDRMINDLHSVWGNFNLKEGLSYDIELKLPTELKKSYIVEPEEIHLQYAINREVFVYENDDKTLPRCVVFRDSTADNILDLLAQHFSRVVFIWHGGNIYEDIIDYEQPDVVIQMMAERFISDYPDKKVAYISSKKA